MVIKINKNLITFLSLILLLGAFPFVVLQKFSSFVSHATYYCQSVINSLVLPIPFYFRTIPLFLFSLFFLVAAVKLLIVYIKVRLSKKELLKNRKFNKNFTKLLEKLALTDKTYLIESKKQFAFCLGIRCPKIYISTRLLNLLTLQEVEAVLRHEQYHLNNRDTLTMLIASIGESLLPFFPLLSDFLQNYRIEREIRADAEAIQGLGNKQPLISVLKKLLATPSVALVTVSSIADCDTLEPRINALVKKDFRFKQFRAKHILISICSVFVMSVIILTPVQAFEIHHQGEDVMMVCPNKNYSEDRMYTPIQ